MKLADAHGAGEVVSEAEGAISALTAADGEAEVCDGALAEKPDLVLLDGWSDAAIGWLRRLRRVAADGESGADPHAHREGPGG